jgi:hypothetical protein
VTFADCAVWVTNNENGRGIHMVDLDSNKVVRTVKKGPIENPVYAVRSDDDRLWAVTWGGPIKLERIDLPSGRPDRSFAIPTDPVWILGGDAWLGSGGIHSPIKDARVMNLETGTIRATIPDLVPLQMWRDASAIWAIARPPDADTSAAENDVDLVRIDPTSLALTRVRLAREAVRDSFEATAHAGALFFPGPGEIRQVSMETGAIVQRIPVDHADQGMRLVSTGTELWALPIEATPLTNGSAERSRHLLQIDPETRAIVRRVALRQRSPMDLSYGYGSLWILAPDDDYDRTFGTHLIRIELPSGG